MRLACFTPLPPAKTGVASYAAALLPRLAGRCAVEAFTTERDPDSPAIRELVPVFHAFRFPERAEGYDAVLYEMGNSSAHRLVFESLLRYPGVVQLHDLVLHHFYLDYYYHSGRALDYARKARAAEGRLGATVARGVKHHLGGSFSYFELPLRAE
ncbi:MAG: hypothetical protein ACREQ9_21130, partial [Candidatus Binatia bacterium]